jgi:hypothetical protein
LHNSIQERLRTDTPPLARPAEIVRKVQNLFRRRNCKRHGSRHALQVTPTRDGLADLELREDRSFDTDLVPELRLRLSRECAEQPRHDVLPSHPLLRLEK